MTKKQFILNNPSIRIKDVAEILKCSPAYVCKIRKPKAKVVIMEHYFDIDKEFKQHYGN